MTDFECECNCHSEEEDELFTFAYCRKCHKRVAVVEKNENLAKLECCGIPMINLDEMPTHVGDTYKCEKCSAEIIVEEDCLCSLNEKECSFICCGEPMKEESSNEKTQCCACSCSRSQEDEESFLYCSSCRALVSVKKPCSCGDDCGIKCCGEKMVDLNTMVSYAGDVFESPSSGIKVLVEEEDFVNPEDEYKPVECDGKPMVHIEKQVDLTDEDIEKDYNTAFYCTACERIVLTSKEGDGRISCCGKKMLNLADLSDAIGEMFECSKCGLKVVVEEDSPFEGEISSPFKCCGKPMVHIEI